MPWRHYGVLGLLTALLVAGLLEPLGPEAAAVAAEAAAPEVGAMAPDFDLPDLNGSQVSLAEYRGKKVVFLNFWAPWCPACRFEMPTMVEFYQRFKDQGLEILAISIDQGNRQSTVDYATENALPFPILLDPRQEVMDRYQATFIPTHILIDRQGRIRHIHVGPKDWRQSDSWRVLEPLLTEP